MFDHLYIHFSGASAKEDESSDTEEKVTSGKGNQQIHLFVVFFQFHFTVSFSSLHSVGVCIARSPLEDDFSVDYFGDLEGANVDELELSPRKESTLRRLMMHKSGLTRQASDVSEASCHISSTPDAESYFRHRKALLDQQSPPDLEIVVSESDGQTKLRTGLEVLPLDGEIDILDLDDPPTLSVKSVRQSSFEALYDAVAENFPVSDEPTRGSFHATFEVPQRVSSFEKLYDKASQEHSGEQTRFGSMNRSGLYPVCFREL